MSTPSRLSAWYPDPTSPSRLRLHDGSRWTSRTSPLVDETALPSEAGFFPDPLSTHRLRRFDGNRWTDQIQPMEVPGPDAPVTPPMNAESTPTQSPVDSQSQDVVTQPHQGPPRNRLLWVAAGIVTFIAAVGLGFFATNVLIDDQTTASPLTTPDATSTPSDSQPEPSPVSPDPTPTPEPQPPGPPEVSIQSEGGSTEFYDVTWDQITVTGSDPARETRINAILDEFTGVQARGYLEAESPVDQTGYWVPGFYEASIEQVSCPEPYLCFVQRGGSMPAGGVSGYYFTETLVVDYKEAERVDIRNFVTEDQLLTLVTKTEQAIAATDEYASGIPLALSADYEQFRNVIPQREGLLIYFSEQEIGSAPVEVLVYWDLSGK